MFCGGIIEYIYIDNTDGVVNPAPCIQRGRLFADPGSRIQGVRVFYHVCIKFISPPEVELCISPLYCACFVRV